MTYEEVTKELFALQNDRGIGYYKKTFGNNGKYLGLGLTQLRKIARKIKINPTLAKQLFESEYFEIRMLGFMIDDSSEYDIKRIEKLLQKFPAEYNESPLSYFTMIFTEFISAKSPDAIEIVTKWSVSKNHILRFVAFSTLNNFGKNLKVNDNLFEQTLPIIELNIQQEANNVKDAMNNSLLSWGQRNKKLHTKTLKALKKIGKITVDYGETSCQTPDVLKILLNERIIKKISQ